MLNIYRIINLIRLFSAHRRSLNPFCLKCPQTIIYVADFPEGSLTCKTTSNFRPPKHSLIHFTSTAHSSSLSCQQLFSFSLSRPLLQILHSLHFFLFSFIFKSLLPSFFSYSPSSPTSTSASTSSSSTLSPLLCLLM